MSLARNREPAFVLMEQFLVTLGSSVLFCPPWTKKRVHAQVFSTAPSCNLTYSVSHAPLIPCLLSPCHVSPGPRPTLHGNAKDPRLPSRLVLAVSGIQCDSEVEVQVWHPKVPARVCLGMTAHGPPFPRQQTSQIPGAGRVVEEL